VIGAWLVGCGMRAAPPWHLVVIEVDGLRASALESQSDEVAELGNIAALARVGVHVDAFSPSGLTAPAIASLWTGLYPRHHGLAGDESSLVPVATALAQILSPAGFHTELAAGGGFPSSSGLARGFDHVDGGGDRLTATEVTDAALAWLDERRREDRFARRMYLHVQYADILPTLREDGRPRADADRYELLLDVADDEVRRLVEALDAYGITKRALVVLVSARGASSEPHAERLDGAASLFDDRTRVPMVFRLPEGRGGGVDGFASTVDFVPTVLEGLGVGSGRVDGVSLWAAVEGERVDGRKHVFAEAGDGGADAPPQRWTNDDRWMSVRSASHRLLWHPPTGAMELYARESDPNELWDAMDPTPEAEAVARELFGPLHAWWYDDRYPDLGGLGSSEAR
jgi:arylsulfatase A-like enzyme